MFSTAVFWRCCGKETRMAAGRSSRDVIVKVSEKCQVQCQLSNSLHSRKYALPGEVEFIFYLYSKQITLSLSLFCTHSNSMMWLSSNNGKFSFWEYLLFSLSFFCWNQEKVSNCQKLVKQKGKRATLTEKITDNARMLYKAVFWRCFEHKTRMTTRQKLMGCYSKSVRKMSAKCQTVRLSSVSENKLQKRQKSFFFDKTLSTFLFFLFFFNTHIHKWAIPLIQLSVHTMCML